ncbi:hypothetical protein LOTGIDRAFT_172586, partial [Lottia gigantea]
MDTSESDENKHFQSLDIPKESDNIQSNSPANSTKNECSPAHAESTIPFVYSNQPLTIDQHYQGESISRNLSIPVARLTNAFQRRLLKHGQQQPITKKLNKCSHKKKPHESFSERLFQSAKSSLPTLNSLDYNRTSKKTRLEPKQFSDTSKSPLILSYGSSIYVAKYSSIQEALQAVTKRHTGKRTKHCGNKKNRGPLKMYDLTVVEKNPVNSVAESESRVMSSLNGLDMERKCCPDNDQVKWKSEAKGTSSSLLHEMKTSEQLGQRIKNSRIQSKNPVYQMIDESREISSSVVQKTVEPQSNISSSSPYSLKLVISTRRQIDTRQINKGFGQEKQTDQMVKTKPQEIRASFPLPYSRECTNSPGQLDRRPRTRRIHVKKSIDQITDGLEESDILSPLSHSPKTTINSPLLVYRGLNIKDKKPTGQSANISGETDVPLLFPYSLKSGMKSFHQLDGRQKRRKIKQGKSFDKIRDEFEEIDETQSAYLYPYSPSEDESMDDFDDEESSSQEDEDQCEESSSQDDEDQSEESSSHGDKVQSEESSSQEVSSSQEDEDQSESGVLKAVSLAEKESDSSYNFPILLSQSATPIEKKSTTYIESSQSTQISRRTDNKSPKESIQHHQNLYPRSHSMTSNPLPFLPHSTSSPSLQEEAQPQGLVSHPNQHTYTSQPNLSGHLRSQGEISHQRLKISKLEKRSTSRDNHHSYASSTEKKSPLSAKISPKESSNNEQNVTEDYNLPNPPSPPSLIEENGCPSLKRRQEKGRPKRRASPQSLPEYLSLLTSRRLQKEEQIKSISLLPENLCPPRYPQKEENHTSLPIPPEDYNSKSLPSPP